jgi:phosphoketolase
MHSLYQTYGQIWTLVVPKMEVIPDLFTIEEASRLLDQGALCLDWACYEKESQHVILTAIGAYQLEEVMKASIRLKERDVPHTVVYMLEPGRFRTPRSEGEERHAAPAEVRGKLYPNEVPARIFITHTRPEPILGIIQLLHTGKDMTSALGFINKGGTLNVPGMLFVNRCSWAHILLEVTRVLGMPQEELLTPEDFAALSGKASPERILF